MSNANNTKRGIAIIRHMLSKSSPISPANEAFIIHKYILIAEDLPPLDAGDLKMNVIQMIADLRDRLELMRPWVCKGCGCAPVAKDCLTLCEDCSGLVYIWNPVSRRQELLKNEPVAAACVSVGLRELFGRRLL